MGSGQPFDVDLFDAFDPAASAQENVRAVEEARRRRLVEAIAGKQNDEPQKKTLEIGSVHRMARRDIGGLRYTVLYDEGDFIHVRVLEGPDTLGRYKATTRGKDGQHLGPGGGWTGESTIMVTASCVEEIPQNS